MRLTTLLLSAGLALLAAAAPSPDLVKRFATNVMPASAGSSSFSTPYVVAAGKSFDGKLVKYDRGTSCTGQAEGGDKDAVFHVEEGGTLKNVIIGKNQIEGVHCLGACTIQNVWWEDVCEDALTIKQSSGTSYVVGGGAFHASDKVVQHNGGGSVSIKDFYVEDFGKLYRSCGNCSSQKQRTVTISGVWAVDGKTLAGVNSNYGDKATISGSCLDTVKTVCAWYEGNDDGDEPTQLGSGISTYCNYANNGIDDCPS
ncbi:polysaccharide lyase family 3 protein [Aplosporella prunicola CBS 121167]|uniref:Pectate lyase n=1 Tax=Aplosporella prunicola CBS 121167 TaxID=1176127 RepID=A0A6A6BPU6_9PEZI|nr:polysaccharide lyase family 3 protein [Aplosporella prunicola CBS 121167]KAF2145325.1 polysaccharide lyase family 3 protein [Aplosporella prunicola CBS 121167]